MKTEQRAKNRYGREDRRETCLQTLFEHIKNRQNNAM